MPILSDTTLSHSRGVASRSDLARPHDDEDASQGASPSIPTNDATAAIHLLADTAIKDIQPLLLDPEFFTMHGDRHPGLTVFGLVTDGPLGDAFRWNKALWEDQPPRWQPRDQDILEHVPVMDYTGPSGEDCMIDHRSSEDEQSTGGSDATADDKQATGGSDASGDDDLSTGSIDAISDGEQTGGNDGTEGEQTGGNNVSGDEQTVGGREIAGDDLEDDYYPFAVGFDLPEPTTAEWLKTVCLSFKRLSVALVWHGVDLDLFFSWLPVPTLVVFAWLSQERWEPQNPSLLAKSNGGGTAGHIIPAKSGFGRRTSLSTIVR
ncbi:hypothetical protein CcaverHIS631_0301230 [Cutaneotrichosporon cavernicola]|nr:hypothetical protein CcaverHIS631_0301230 [Cutaneotrichosporon cavernicola]